jgi:predicted lipoprotein with Yx(FWY)xxD motif
LLYRIERCLPRPRREIALALTLVATLGTTSAFAAGSAAAHGDAKAPKPTVKIAQTAVGPLLAAKSGYTVYLFLKDKRRKDECVKIKGCEKDWPAVTTKDKLVAGPGVKKALLGSIPYTGKVNGKTNTNKLLREVTYKGHPLHTYRFDSGRGSVINIGNRQFGGAWYALNAKGGVVK